MRRRAIALSLALAIGTSLFLAAPAADATPRKVRLCHRDVNSWSLRVVSPRRAYNVHLDHPGFDYDIIEPFKYRGKTYSLNWNAENEAFLENGCRHPGPENDLPSGAIPLTLGVTANGDTRGAAAVGEETTACLGEPVWHSIWYTFEGTGDPVEIALSSPDFWPNGAVYVQGADGSFAEMASQEGEPWCIWSDGTPMLESFPTEVGVTYFIQIGGFSETIADAGPIALTVT